jgi:hypothetical protein
MTAEMTCEHVTELAAELALDVATGPERDAAHRHLASCASCRRLVAELSSAADDLLLLAPPDEPPPGFESRVLDALRPPRRARRGWRSPVAALAAAALGAVVAVAAVLAATSADRRLAADYRDLLASAGGSSFSVAELRGPGGRVGTVFGYRGDPSWVFVSVPGVPAGEATSFGVRLTTTDGRSFDLGEAALGGDARGWGRAIPVDLDLVRGLRLSGAGGELTATFSEGTGSDAGTDGTWTPDADGGASYRADDRLGAVSGAARAPAA